VRVVAALSGGVDSAVAAARALDAGHEVVGVHLALARRPQAHRTGARGCCTLDDARDARRVADLLGIPFYVWDLAEEFEREVVGDFLAEYASGRTPNPCLRCNERIKFAAVLDRAVALGFDAVCTGHYAIIEDRPGLGRVLRRGVDPAKDQSYVLGVLTGEQLARSLFPLGGLRKAEVRAEAAARGLLVADKPDSHDLCFIPDGDTAGFLARALGPAEGAIVDVDGAEVGRHQGAWSYTVGQRRGLQLGRPAADGRPRFVLAVEPVRNEVVVGPREALAVTWIRAEAPRWCGTPSHGAFDCLAQVRAHGAALPARAEVTADGLEVALAAPLLGVAPGQAVVLYLGDRVVGSGTIAEARSAVGAG
jgi:tRNA-specific 2-thiouridylase